MLAIGRALMASPKLLLLDEPSLGLAPRIIGQIGEVIAEINRQGTSVLLVEQNATMALGVADLAYVLDVGEVSLSGDARELAQHRRGAAPLPRPRQRRARRRAAAVVGQDALAVDGVTAAPDADESIRSDIPAVEVDNVSVRFGAIKALSEVSFTVEPGTIHAIIGPNGAGKSTMFNVLSGVYKAAEGQVRFGDAPAGPDAALPDRRHRRGARVPEHRAVGHPVRGREPHARPPPPDQGRVPRRRAAAAAGHPRGQAARRAGRRDRRVPRARRQAAHARSASSPTATRSGSRWRGRCAPSRGCCCSTSRWPA